MATALLLGFPSTPRRAALYDVRKPEPIGALETMKELSHELRRFTRMLVVPVLCDDQQVRSGDSHTPVWKCLVQHDLGMSGVEFATSKTSSRFT